MLDQEPRYESYKDSGEIWLGKVPTDWSLENIRAVTELKSKRGEPDLRVLSVYRDYGVIPKDSRDDNHNATSLDTSNYKVVEPGDLVVNKMKAWQGSMGVSEHRGIVSPAYITCKTDADKVVPRFLHYLLRSQPFIAVYNSLSYGVRIGQWDMHYEDFKKIPLAYPDLDTQNRIVSFLDEKTAEIDAAIAKKRRLIDLLNEQKAILINRAVTKGLNPDAPMKDSGVDWVGEIPAHWDVKRVKQVCRLITKGTTPSTEGKGFADEGIRYIKAENIVNGQVVDAPVHFIDERTDRLLARSRLQAGDVLFVIAGATIGKTAVLAEYQAPANTNQAVSLLRPNTQKVDPTFLEAWLQSDHVKHVIAMDAVQSAQPNISMEDLGNIALLVPPLPEQGQLVGAIEEIRESYSMPIRLQQREISTLNEFKQTLIANAVTGKIKI